MSTPEPERELLKALVEAHKALREQFIRHGDPDVAVTYDRIFEVICRHEKAEGGQ